MSMLHSSLWDMNLTIYPTEQDLVQGLRRGESMSCTCLFKQFEPRLAHLADRLANESVEAEEIVQESFIHACGSILSFRADSTLATWLHRITVNTALMQRRKKHIFFLPLEEISNEQQVQPLHLSIEIGDDPLEQVILQEKHQRIRQAIHALPGTLRDVFLLRVIEDLSTREAAGLLGITETALKVRFYRARLALKNSLQAE